MRLLSQEGSKCLFPRASMRVTQAPNSKYWAVECLFSYPCPRVRHPKVSTQFLPDKAYLKNIIILPTSFKNDTSFLTNKKRKENKSKNHENENEKKSQAWGELDQ